MALDVGPCGSSLQQRQPLRHIFKNEPFLFHHFSHETKLPARSERPGRFTSIPAKKWGDTEIAERGRSVLVMRARYRSFEDSRQKMG